MEQVNERCSKRYYSGTDIKFTEICVGDYINDDCVSKIFQSNPRAIVFLSDDFVTWVSVGDISKQRKFIAKLDFLLDKASGKFKGVHKFRIDMYKISILTSVFEVLRSGEEYDLGEVDGFVPLVELERFICDNAEIKSVIDRSKDFVVWIDDGGEVAYETRSSKVFDSRIFTRLAELRSMGRVMLAGGKRTEFFLKLASSLVVAFRSGDDIDGAFESAQAYLDKTLEAHASSRVVYSVLFFSAALSLAVFSCYLKFSSVSTPNLNLFCIGLGGGLLGALMSVLQRSRDIKVGQFESTSLIVLQGLIRVGLGCCFGVVAIVASKSGIFFEFLSGDNKKLFFLAMAAGVSERLIPDIFDRVTEMGR